MRTRLKNLLHIVGELRARRRARSRARERRVLAIGRARRAFRTPGGAAVKIAAALIFAFGCGISLGIGIAAIADRTWDTEESVAANSASEAKPISESAHSSKPTAKGEPVYSVPVRVRRLPSGPTPQADTSEVAKALPRAGETPAAVTQSEPSTAQPQEPANSVATDGAESQPARPDTIKAPDTDRADHAPTSLAAKALARPDTDNSTTSDAHDAPLVSIPAPQSAGEAPQQTAPLPGIAALQSDAQSGPLGNAASDAPRVDAADPALGGYNFAGVDSSAPDTGNQTESARAVGETAETGEFVVASLPPPSEALWIRNAVETPPTSGDAMIAIIIDDMGIDQKRSRRAIEMAAPLTLSFIPYGYHLHELTAKARAAGHEIMLHLPMEPLDPEANPGPNALLTKLNSKEILRRLRWGLDRFGGYVGINNHMGSKFTAWRPGMKLVMNEIRSRGLMFLDSWTNNRSVGLSLSKEFKVPSASRDIFIDHDISRVAIKHSLAELEYIARQRGFAVGIGHPHDLTLEMLARWVSDARSRGIDFVPISAIVRRGMKSG